MLFLMNLSLGERSLKKDVLQSAQSVVRHSCSSVNKSVIASSIFRIFGYSWVHVELWSMYALTDLTSKSSIFFLLPDAMQWLHFWLGAVRGILLPGAHFAKQWDSFIILEMHGMCTEVSGLLVFLSHLESVMGMLRSWRFTLWQSHPPTCSEKIAHAKN